MNLLSIKSDPWSVLSSQTSSGSPGSQAVVSHITYNLAVLIGDAEDVNLGHSACQADVLPPSHSSSQPKTKLVDNVTIRGKLLWCLS